MITIVPSGGLCDRLMTIESALSLASQVNEKQIKLKWKLNKELNCPFEDLFQPINTVSVENVEDLKLKKKTIFTRVLKLYKRFWLKYILREEIINLFDLSELSQETKNEKICEKYVKQYKNITIEGFGQFSQGETTYYNSFIPIKQIEDEIDNITLNFSNEIIGVHIRRTDNTFAINESPTILFIDKIKSKLNENPKTRFYVATDSVNELDNLIYLFGDKIHYQKNCIRERTSVKGMKCAVVDLYTLAQTNMIWGSYWSVYSYVASQIGKKPFMSIYKNSK